MVTQLVNRAQLAAMAGVSGAAITKACSLRLAPAVSGRLVDINHPVVTAYIADKLRQKEPDLAPGIDARYDDAVRICAAGGRWTASYIARQLHLGYHRAEKIIAMIEASGLVPEKAEPGSAPHTVELASLTPEPEKKEPHIRGTHARREKKKVDPEQLSVEIPDDIQIFADMTLRELINKFGTDFRFVDWLAAVQKIEAINEKRLKNAQTEGELISRQLVKVGVIDTFNSAHLRLMKDGAKSIAAGVVSKSTGGADLGEIESYVSDILGSFIKPIKSKIDRVLRHAGH